MHLLLLFSLCLHVVRPQDTSKLRPPPLRDLRDDLTPADVYQILESFRDEFPQVFRVQNESECAVAWIELESKHVVRKVSGVNTSIRGDLAALDYFGKPGSGITYGNLQYPGSFDECLGIEVGIPMQHCMMEVIVIKEITLQPVFTFLQGICIPRNCTPKDVFDIVYSLNPLLPTGMVFFVNYTSNGNPLYYCTQQGDTPYSAGAIVMLCICAIFVLLVLVGSAYHLAYEYYEEHLEDREELSPVHTPNIDPQAQETEPLLKSTTSQKPTNIAIARLKTFLHEGMIGFSLYKTIPTLISTYQPPSAITSLNGMRVISMFWVILGHTYFFLFALSGFKNMTMLLLDFAPRFSAQPILNGFYSVDSFFFISGFLVAYLTFREMSRRKGKFPFVTYYLHRILRLTPTYMFVLFFFWFLTVHLTKGPKTPTIAGPGTSAYQSCVDYWWSNLLYINNFVPSSFSKECMGWTWYLANDMQFFVITPMFLILLYVWFPAGIAALGITLLASMGVTGFIAGYYNYPANIFYTIFSGDQPDPRQPSVDTSIYGKPYCRIGPYLVGILLGYIIFKNYRLNFSKTLNLVCHILLWVVAFVIGLSTVYGFYSSFHGYQLSKAENVIYFIFSRTVWGLALAIVTYVCHYGYGGFVNKFLSLPFWVPLSRLTFNAYLVHEIILEVIYSDLRDTIAYADSTMAVFCIAAIVLSYGSAAVVTIFVEFPLSNLEIAAFKMFGAKVRESSRNIEKPPDQRIDPVNKS